MGSDLVGFCIGRWREKMRRKLNGMGLQINISMDSGVFHASGTSSGPLRDLFTLICGTDPLRESLPVFGHLVYFLFIL